MQVVVWVCPTDGCGNYFASSSQAHLDLGAEDIILSSMQHKVGDTPGQVIGNRGVCPECKQNGNIVQRRRIEIRLNPLGSDDLHAVKTRVIQPV